MDLKEQKRLKKLELLGLFNPREGESMMMEDVRVLSPTSVAETMGMMGEDIPAPETRRRIRRELLGITTGPMMIAEPVAPPPKTLGKTRYEKVNEYRTSVVRGLVASLTPELQTSFYLTCYGSAVRMKNFGKPGNERQYESFQKQVEESLKEAVNKANPVAPKILEYDYQSKYLDPEEIAKMGQYRNSRRDFDAEENYYKPQVPPGDADEREMFERYRRILPLVPQKMESGETYYVAPSWGPDGYGREWNPYLYTKEGKRVGWRVLVGLEGERLGAVITDKRVPIIRSGGHGYREGKETVTNPALRLLDVSFDKSLRTRPVVSDTHYGDIYALSGDYIGQLKKERTGKVILTPEGNPIVELQPYSEKRMSAQPKTSWDWVFDSYTFGWYSEDFSRGGRSSSYAWNQPGFEGKGKIIYDWEWLKSGTKDAEDEVRRTQPKSIEEYGFPEICLYASLKNTGADLNPIKRFLAQKLKDEKVAKEKKDAEEATAKAKKVAEEKKQRQRQSEQAERRAKAYPEEWEQYQDQMLFPFSEEWGGVPPFSERTEEQHIKYSQDYARWIFGTYLSPVQKEVLLTVGYGSRFNACLVSLDYFVNTPEFSEINKKRREVRDSVEPFLARAKQWIEDLVHSPRFDKPPIIHTPPDFRETHFGYFNARERLENERENPDDPVNLGADFGSAVEGKSFRDMRPEYRSPAEMVAYWRLVDDSLAKFASKTSLKDIRDHIEFLEMIVRVTISEVDTLLSKK